MRPTIIFYPNKAKKSKKNGKHPLYMRVLFNDQKTEARLAAELTDLEVEL